ncbi:unnamed protein product [Agarophyton chilense]
MSKHFTPSPMSLAVFDEIKKEKDGRMAAALESVRAIKTPLRSNCTRDSRVSENPGPQTAALSFSEKDKAQLEMSRAKGVPKNPLSVNCPKLQTGVSSAQETNECSPGRWRVVSGMEGTRAGGVHSSASCSLTSKAEADEWAAEVKAYQSKLRGERSSGWKLAERNHIPYQLRSLRASPASGASNGWELNSRMVSKVRERMSRGVEGRKSLVSTLADAMVWVAEKVSRVVGHFLRSLGKWFSFPG